MKAAKAHAAAGNRNLIEAHGLVKNFDGFSLRDVDLVVEPGQVVGFVGKNGAGKSTTIRALLGMISLDGGSARVLGHDSWALSSESASRVKGQIGVVFDTLSLPGHLRVREVGTMMAGAYGAAWDADGFVRRLEGFGLDGAKNLKDLSRGMGMKLSLACALSHGARLLILDEATAGLDPMARDEILDILSTFVAEEGDDGSLGNGILMSSHITSDLEKIADVVVCIDQGRIVFSAPKEAITDEMGVARCRATDLDRIVESGALGGEPPRCIRHAYGIDALVPDRFAFSRRFPDIPVDRMTIDDYMAFMLKGTSDAAR